MRRQMWMAGVVVIGACALVLSFLLGEVYDSNRALDALARRPVQVIVREVAATPSPRQMLGYVRVAFAAMWATAWAGPTATPWSLPTPLPSETAIPLPTVDRPAARRVRVVMSYSLGAGETAAAPANVFSAGLPQVYCVVTFSRIGPSDRVIVQFMSLDQNIKIWAATQTDFHPPISVPSTDASRSIYLSGPFNPGRYACDIVLNGRLAGRAAYIMR